MHTPLLSIVIPCFNQGVYLKDALASLAACDQNLFEVIIVNDGSTDGDTNQYLQAISAQGYTVVFQENTGLGQARNNGIKKAAGKYILPLDSDNMIRPGYITESLALMERQPEVAVVYGNAAYFGDKTGVLKPGPFNLQRLMLGNYIDACAVIRRSVLEEVGGYDNMEIMGYEDWDLWLRLGFKDYRFHYIDEVLFDYRVRNNSMMHTLNADIKRQNEIEAYFTHKYTDKLSFETVRNHFIYKLKKRPFRFLYVLIMEKYFPAYYKRLIREHKMYRGGLYD
jgi:glycosyltransferase involved in cell wall biosynthesis